MHSNFRGAQVYRSVFGTRFISTVQPSVFAREKRLFHDSICGPNRSALLKRDWSMFACNAAVSCDIPAATRISRIRAPAARFASSWSLTFYSGTLNAQHTHPCLEQLQGRRNGSMLRYGPNARHSASTSITGLVEFRYRTAWTPTEIVLKDSREPTYPTVGRSISQRSDERGGRSIAQGCPVRSVSCRKACRR